jgi:hypothetical protein
MRRGLAGITLAVGLLAGGCGGGGDTGAATGNCPAFTPAAASPYTLPWALGQSYVANPHAIWDPTVQRFAYDAKMPIGTDILAMRAGTVVRVEESFVDGDTTPGHENFVFVQHDDGTVARYVHLTNGGALVTPGDAEKRGQRIALSGHTGNSAAPHLHFDVTRSCCAAPPDNNALPAGETLPLSFHNASPDSGCGLRDGVRYSAAP